MERRHFVALILTGLASERVAMMSLSRIKRRAFIAGLAAATASFVGARAGDQQSNPRGAEAVVRTHTDRSLCSIKSVAGPQCVGLNTSSFSRSYS
jgi:hypothetical protein